MSCDYEILAREMDKYEDRLKNLTALLADLSKYIRIPEE
jgi:hypothetical protein